MKAKSLIILEVNSEVKPQRHCPRFNKFNNRPPPQARLEREAEERIALVVERAHSEAVM